MAEKERDVDAEQAFRAVVENTPDLIARFDSDLRRLYVNPAIERLTGRQAADLIGKTMRDLNFNDRFSGPIEDALKEVFATGVEKMLEVHLPGAGEERVYQARIVPERGPHGEVQHALVISRDITAIRRDQDRLRSLTREIELLLASTYEGICATDVSGRCTLVNPSAAAMLGYTPAEMLGGGLHELIHHRRADGLPCEADNCALFNTAESGKPAHVTSETLRRKDGSTFPADMFISPILGEDKVARGIVVSFIDVTERTNLQTELERANRMAGLGRVASAMSHDFNNVLMGIQPFADIILRSSAEPRVVDAANRILGSVKRGHDITEDLRAFLRPDPPLRTPIDIHLWLPECARELADLLSSNIHFELRITDEPMVIGADRGQITRVLSSFIVNAREAIGHGHGSIRLSASLTTDNDRFLSSAPFVDLSVTDSGRGIEPQNLSHIFEPFFTTKEGGRGLGLAIAEQIATLHGGQLSVQSQAGSTVMHLFLPAF